MSAGLAPGPIIMATGSPGATLRSTNTTTATPNNVTAIMASRLRKAMPINQPPFHSEMPERSRTPPRAGPLSSPLSPEERGRG